MKFYKPYKESIMGNKFMLVLALAFNFSFYGQENIKVYSGETLTPSDIIGYGINNIKKGKTTYSYYESENGKRIKHGSFEFIYSNPFLDDNRIKGQYENGKKTGTWYIYSGQQEVTVTYQNDNLNGPFMAKIDPYNEVIKIEGNLKEGNYFGEITISSSGLEGNLKGFFNVSGWADGEWVMERKKGIPIKQTRNYYNGFLLNVIEFDYSTGEEKIIYELEEKVVDDIKSTLNPKDNTLKVSEVHYIRIPLNTDDDFDSKFYWGGGGKASLKRIFSDYRFLGGIIPYKNGFAALKKNNEWYEQRKKEEELLRLQKKEDAIKDAKIIADKRNENIESLIKEVRSNNKAIQELYTTSFLGKEVKTKRSIFDAYERYYNYMFSFESRNEINLGKIIEIQEIVKKLKDKSTRNIEKKLNRGFLTFDDIYNIFIDEKED